MKAEITRIEYHVDSNGIDGDIDPVATKSAFAAALGKELPNAIIDVRIHEKTPHAKGVPQSAVFYSDGSTVTGDKAVELFRGAVRDVKPVLLE